MKKSMVHTFLILGAMAPIGCGKLNMPTTPSAQTTTTQAPTQATTPQFVSSWSTAGQEQLVNPQGIAADGNGYVYVTDMYLDVIFKYDSNGNLIDQFGKRNSIALDQPSGIAVKNGNVFVADSANARIVEFDTSGNHLMDLAPKDADGYSLFLYPTGISLDNQGNLYVADNSDQVFEFNSSLQLVATWGSSGSTNGAFDYPVVSAENGFGNIFVVNNNSDKITKIDPQTNIVSNWGTYGTQNGQFDGPSDIKLDANGDVYVVDAGNNRVQAFSSNGNYLYQFGNSSDNSQNLNGPNSMTFDNNGNIYVVDTGNTRIVKYTTK